MNRLTKSKRFNRYLFFLVYAYISSSITKLGFFRSLLVVDMNSEFTDLGLLFSMKNTVSCNRAVYVLTLGS